jgi:hypothetical protein
MLWEPSGLCAGLTIIAYALLLAFIAMGRFSYDLLPASLVFILVKIGDPLGLSSGHNQ